MDQDEVEAAVEFIAADPAAGDLMPGTGGCRKIRFAGRSKGKRGGYRVVTFFTGQNLPIFLLTVFGKGERSDLTKAEQNALAKLTKLLVAEYGTKIGKAGAGR